MTVKICPGHPSHRCDLVSRKSPQPMIETPCDEKLIFRSTSISAAFGVIRKGEPFHCRFKLIIRKLSFRPIGITVASVQKLKHCLIYPLRLCFRKVLSVHPTAQNKADSDKRIGSNTLRYLYEGSNPGNFIGLA